jgi:hypothetical protein
MRRAILCAVALAACASTLAGQRRDLLPVPDLPGYRTLKGDFHLHTVFSDGEVWPTVHVREAWRDGLDVIALSDHLEYRPHAADVKADGARPYAVARALAAELGIILIPAVEITKPPPGVPSALPVGSAHFNALFVRDPDALNVPELQEALRRAREQGAFVFWNHPGFLDAPPQWFPHVEAAWQAGLFRGIELVNGDRVYAELLPRIVERGLTILSNSDAHVPMPPRAAGAIRPLTLLFARTADLSGVREALEAGRTAAWARGEVWGAEDHLRGLWERAARLETAPVAARAGGAAALRFRNTSAISFSLRHRAAPPWLRIVPATIAAESGSLLPVTLDRNAPAGTHALALELEVANLRVTSGGALTVRVPTTIEVIR